MRMYFSRIEQYAVVVLLVAIVAALMVLSYRQGAANRQSAAAPLLVPAAQAQHGDPARPTGLVVHVAGAVRKPGVYTLPAGTRVVDALEAAGGMQTDACPDALNLAEKVLDGEKIFVPTQAEWAKMGAAAVSPVTYTHSGVSLANSGVKQAKTPPANTERSQRKTLPPRAISLNTATLAELQRLPGVGPGLAKKILDYRKSIGRFTDLSQLQNVSGIGAKRFEKIAPFVTL